MIDTDKYEGHSKGPWYYTLETEDKIWDEHGAVWDKDKNCLALVDDGSEQFPDADLKLIADAPLLLAEVQRLRLAIQNVADFPKRCPPALKLKGVIDAMVCMLREAIE